jgi:2-iminobutanoate/2-iminopropanoate deaminase
MWRRGCMSHIVKKIETEKAPKAIGPYSQGVKYNHQQEIIFVSGQLPIDPEGAGLIQGDMRKQTHRVIDNIEAILTAAGSNLKQVLKVEIFLKDLKGNFKEVNEVYAERFVGSPEPARQTVQVSELPLGASIEISCIAYTGE